MTIWVYLKKQEEFAGYFKKANYFAFLKTQVSKPACRQPGRSESCDEVAHEATGEKESLSLYLFL